MRRKGGIPRHEFALKVGGDGGKFGQAALRFAFGAVEVEEEFPAGTEQDQFPVTGAHGGLRAPPPEEGGVRMTGFFAAHKGNEVDAIERGIGRQAGERDGGGGDVEGTHCGAVT